jgi:hypothetical protein
VLRADRVAKLAPSLLATLTADERAVLEAATGEMGNKPDAVKLGWLKMRTKESWTKQRYAITVGRALAKLRKLVEQAEGSV